MAADAVAPRVRKKGGKKWPRRHKATDYDQSIARRICELVANGETIRRICARKDYPSKSTVFNWLHAHEDFARAYALAKQCYAEDLVDSTVRVADDLVSRINRKGDDGKHHVRARAAELLIRTRFALAALLAPNKYGVRPIAPALPYAIPFEDEDARADAARTVSETGAPAPAAEPEAPSPMTILEHHPLYEELQAWRKAAKDAMKN